MRESETIAAVATAPGPAALAVVRVSGPEAHRIAESVAAGLDGGKPWRAQLVKIRLDDEVEDEAVAIPYKAPRSYTGEDMVELIVHGSDWLTAKLLDRLLEHGARLARPGEFTRRAFLNGKVDLLQAEGIKRLIEAEDSWSARMARAMSSGRASDELRALRRGLLDAMSKAEAAVEFGIEVGELDGLISEFLEELLGFLKVAKSWSEVTSVPRVVIAGPPNAGKSTLFNALLARERAIVADTPGTTRDVLEESCTLGGRRVRLVDTAGLGKPGSEVERVGMERAKGELSEADWVIAVRAADGPCWEPPEGVVVIARVMTRVDLAGAGFQPEPGWIGVNLLSPEGKRKALAAVEAGVKRMWSPPEGSVALGRRHVECLEKAKTELEKVLGAELEVQAEGLRWAARYLGEITGEVSDEELLDRVFSSFCIGK